MNYRAAVILNAVVAWAKILSGTPYSPLPEARS